ncbi:hypothetical protein P4644_16135 [Priestia aryabhattai]|uniref:hypothetical protein n=1 Tax=Priestia aryabhattai TaxID=412384 RepID=UPI002E212E92|nr:hypothetical protein [Priestia aryabhattai]
MSIADDLVNQIFEKSRKSRKLKNAEITHVSYVDKPANKRPFFMTKSEGAEREMKLTPELVTEALEEALQPIREGLKELEEKANIQKAVNSVKQVAKRVEKLENEVAVEKAEAYKEDMFSQMDVLVEVSKQNSRKQTQHLADLFTKGEE